MSLLQIYEPGESPAPHEKRTAIGIDLGTTNSVAAILRKDMPVALENQNGKSIIPSAVYYKEQQVFIGEEAFLKAQEDGTQPIQSIKRLMGRGAAEITQYFPYLTEYQITREDQLPAFLLDGKERTPISISADILIHLKAVAEYSLEEEVTDAVITVPAYFDDAARLATKQAAQIAGLNVLRLINEPTAAALAYGLEHGREGIYAVYDLGGGTFDISILNLEKGVFQVLATAGDTALGGHDMDVAVAAYLLERHGLDYMPQEELLYIARQMKERMAGQVRADDEIDDRLISLASDELDIIVTPFVERTLRICREALEDANVQSEALAGVVLVGGATRLKVVRQLVGDFFHCPVYNDLDPDRVVAYGAAIQADALIGGAEHLLLDVTPLSLGLETMGGIVEKIIYRNTPIPAEASQEFTTFKDSQTGMQFHIVQGERELAEQCRSLAQFELSGIPPMPAGIARVEVKFLIDADGLLTVTAQEKTTAIHQSIHVKPSYGLPIEQIERMILESMEHGRQDIMDRLLVEARIDAMRTVEETISALEHDGNLLEEKDRDILEAAITSLKALYESSSREAIDEAHQQLKNLLEPFAEKRMNHAIQKALAGKRMSDMNA